MWVLINCFANEISQSEAEIVMPIAAIEPTIVAKVNAIVGSIVVRGSRIPIGVVEWL